MPVEREIDGRVCVMRLSGDYSPDEALQALSALVSDPGLPADAQLLIDLRESMSVLRRSIMDLRRITAHFGKHAHHFGNRCALLVTGTARFGLMRMASMWIESRGVDARVFRGEAEARAWLVGPGHS